MREIKLVCPFCSGTYYGLHANEYYCRFCWMARGEMVVMEGDRKGTRQEYLEAHRQLFVPDEYINELKLPEKIA